MSNELETFILYYISWHEGEFNFTEFKENVIAEIGQDGLTKALNEFKYLRGTYRTYYEAQKAA